MAQAQQARENGQQTALAKQEEPKKKSVLERTVGSYRDRDAIAARMQMASRHWNLVAPTMAAPQLPEGCSVVLAAVQIDTRPVQDGGEIYNVGQDSWGLSRSALDRIAAAAGISWDVRASGRRDDGSDPLYCSWEAVGTIRDFDGTLRYVVGNKEMDLRDGSPQVEAIVDRCIGTERKYAKGRSEAEVIAAGEAKAAKQIRDMRLHILSHAETKARLRATRALGLKSSYKRADLEKPFVVAKMMWTGETSDPELRRLFALKQQEAMLGGMRALYGDAAASSAPRLQPGNPRGDRPPPIGTVPVEAEDLVLPAPAGEVIDIENGPAEQPRTPAPQPPPAQSGGDNGNGSAELTIPGGQEKGTPISEASDGTLRWWANKIGRGLEEGTTDERYRQQDEALLKAMTDEIARREQGPAQDPAVASGDLFTDEY